LENAVGIGFGMFDLVITDEAHKNRAPESGLSTLLNNVIWQSDLVRHVVLTATPVELDATQWGDILQRIGLDQKKCQQLQCIINDYTASVQRLRQCWRTSQEARANYAESARKFHQALAPYLLRRDKREDDDVKLFNTHSGRPINEYRHQREILVETKNLSSAWKQAVCAAEALSLVARQSDNAEAKRLRLTLANGHGIATLLDKIKRSDADNLQEKNDAEDPTETIDPKRSARNQWWLNTIALAFANDSHSLLHHPSIIAAVNAIEEVTASGGKVLVFGRFTTPMHALVGLLNAREMLRRIDKKQSWPQTKVHVEDWKEKVGIDDLAAVRAAHIQLGSRVDLAKLDRTLTSRYKVESERREELRKNLLDTIKRGMKKMKMAPDAMNWKLFSAFEKSAKSQDGTKADDRHPVALMSRALSELLGDSGRKFSAHDYAVGFCELIDALSDKGDDDGDDMDDDQASERWDALELRLEEEYNRPEGGFSRLMNGETKHETRRVLQLAFNRDHSFPKVLVAQSMVGREGLNLHKACRTVVMLHPEWNPGVVEQQIGRVDRVGSHWSKELKDAINMDFSAEKLPRIEVRPVIFRGTYDEYNWNVLQERWDDLRAQLHGIVIPPRLVEPKNQYLADEIAAAAPNFSPSPT
jgi:superfamily II DNA or RNA helicase